MFSARKLAQGERLSGSSRAVIRSCNLIVTCNECSTSFQLDESRIPASGARVRCSRCKHAFFLPNPSASVTEVVDTIAEEVAEDPTAGLPAATTDLAGLDGSIASEANPAEPEAELDDEEEDWQFTEEIRTEADDDPDDEENFGSETDFSEGFDEGSLSDGTLEGNLESEPVLAAEVVDDEVHNQNGVLDVEEKSELEGSIGESLEITAVDELSELDQDGLESGRDDSSFGDVEDFSALTEDASLDADNHASMLGAEAIDESASGVYVQPGSTEDLGDPESWDLSPDADFASPKPSIAGLVDTYSSGSSDDSRFSASSDSALDPADFDAELREQSKMAAGLKLLGSGLGWLGVVVAISVVAYLSFAPEWQRWNVIQQTFTERSFSAQTTTTRWVDTSRTGPLLIVDGIARNSGREAVWPTALQVSLLDALGGEISDSAVSIGLPLSEWVIREGSTAELKESMAIAAERFRTSPMGPGESRAFQAIIASLPPTARRFVLEPASEATQELGSAVEEPKTEGANEVEFDQASGMESGDLNDSPAMNSDGFSERLPGEAQGETAVELENQIEKGEVLDATRTEI